MDSPDLPSSSSSSSHTRSLRAFAQREDAERARAVLADHDIGSTLREFMVPDSITGKPVSRGCSLFVDPARANEATRVILKLPPSEAPAAVTAKQATHSPTRLRRHNGPATKQKGSHFIIIFAVICAAGGMIFATTYYGRTKPSPLPVDDSLISIEEDLNGDTLPDVWREFTHNWEPVAFSEDRNFDTLVDVRWLWANGKPSRRKVDLNFDGKFDEFTTYDPRGQIFFTDIRPGETGPVLVRRIFRNGALWKILEDRDRDSNFDHLTEYNDIAAIVREEELPKGSDENKYPAWPPPAAPKGPEDGEPAGPKMNLKK